MIDLLTTWWRGRRTWLRWRCLLLALALLVGLVGPTACSDQQSGGFVVQLVLDHQTRTGSGPLDLKGQASCDTLSPSGAWTLVGGGFIMEDNFPANAGTLLMDYSRPLNNDWVVGAGFYPLIDTPAGTEVTADIGAQAVCMRAPTGSGINLVTQVIPSQLTYPPTVAEPFPDPAPCPSGMLVTGGGFGIENHLDNFSSNNIGGLVRVRGTFPLGDPKTNMPVGWQTNFGRELGGVGVDTSVTTYAVCLTAVSGLSSVPVVMSRAGEPPNLAAGTPSCTRGPLSTHFCSTAVTQQEESACSTGQLLTDGGFSAVWFPTPENANVLYVESFGSYHPSSALSGLTWKTLARVAEEYNVVGAAAAQPPPTISLSAPGMQAYATCLKVG